MGAPRTSRALGGRRETPIRGRTGALALPLALLTAGCVGLGDCGGSDSLSEPPYDASRKRRVIEPPRGEVRALPPHAIHGEGIGPYVIGASLKNILDLLPFGPRVVLVEIDGVVDYSLVRAERGSILIGVEVPLGVSFLTVLDDEIAKTETQVGVGSGESQLREALGPELSQPSRVTDPRLLGFRHLPGVRFLLDDAPRSGGGARGERQVTAVVVFRGSGDPGSRMMDASPSREAESETGDAVSPPSATPPPNETPAGTAPAQPAPPRCADPAPLAPYHGVIRDAARLEPGKGHRSSAGSAARLEFGCFSIGQSEATLGAIVAQGDRLAVVAVERSPGRADPDKPDDTAADARPPSRPEVEPVAEPRPRVKRVASYTAAGPIVYAAAMDLHGDGRHQVVTVTEQRSPVDRVVGIELARFESGRLIRAGASELYRVSKTRAAWVGAQLDDIELVIELDGRGDRVRATGLYIQRDRDGRLATVAALLPRTVMFRRKRPLSPGETPAPADRNGGAGLGEPSRGDGGPAQTPKDAGIRSSRPLDP